MPDESVKNTKLVQYLNEAYGKEKELEAALQAHIGMTTRPPYKKRLQSHLRETKGHARELERRIKKLSGDGPAKVASVAGQAAGQVKSLAKGPLHIVRGTGEAEKMLKNAKTEYHNEHEEIATYTAIETLAESVGDRETATLARSIRRDEERMASFLERQIPTLTKAVVREEIPASERRTASRRRRRSTRRSTTSSKARRGSSGSRSRSTSKTRRASSGSRSSSTSRRRASSASGRRSTSGTRRRSTSSSGRRSTASSGRRSTSGSRGRSTASSRGRSTSSSRGRSTSSSRSSSSPRRRTTGSSRSSSTRRRTSR